MIHPLTRCFGRQDGTHLGRHDREAAAMTGREEIAKWTEEYNCSDVGEPDSELVASAETSSISESRIISGLS